MIKRTVEISSRPARLSVRNRQLVITQDGDQTASIPCEDIGVLLVDQPATAYTHGALTALLDQGAAVVLCGPDHVPAGVLLPTAANQLQAERLARQIQAKRPLKKRLWQQVVRVKIRHQAETIGPDHPHYRRIRNLAADVRSGDPSNVEAQAARLYWQALFNEIGFRRGRDNPPPNNLLNYGYAVLRAAVARAVCAGGLHPSIGIHHHNRYDAFCLADDIMEPYRPYVDHRVRGLVQDGCLEINRESKARLLDVLTDQVVVADQSGPLMVALHRTVASLDRCFQGSADRLELPEP